MMTETEWIKCIDIHQMVIFLKHGFKTEEPFQRKLRLLMCAHARTCWDDLRLDARHAVEIAELYADHKATKNDLIEANCFNDLIGLPGTKERTAALIAKDCLGYFYSNHVWYLTKSRKKIVSSLIHEIFPNPFWINPTNCSQCKRFTFSFGCSTKTMDYIEDQCNICRGTGKVNVVWINPQVINFAHLIYEHRDFDSIPILGDMLEENGCIDEVILDHCRQLNHVLGCWILDLILDKS